jgi:mono/diheme cytochrome c family protein
LRYILFDVMKAFRWVALGMVIVLAVIAAWLYRGGYDFAADSSHSPIVGRLIEVAREQSIAARAKSIVVPKLDDPALIAEGVEHYSEMCTDCHLAPGMQESEIRPGLNPRPPELARRLQPNPARDFWIIKHGIKMSGMPAWGATHSDAAIWGMVAFLQKLPTLSAAAYKKMTAVAHETPVDADRAETDDD